MLFPISGVEVNPFIPPLVAFFISFFASMGGISGAFLLLPFQMSFLGYTHPSVSATNQLFNIIAIPSGVYRYWREGRLVWPMVLIVVIGTLPGVFIGAIIRVLYLPDSSQFKLFAAVVLLYVGGKMLLDMRKASPTAKAEELALQEKIIEAQKNNSAGQKNTQVLSISLRELRFSFYNIEHSISILGVSVLCFVVGIVGGIYGIGGGAIIAPFFITFFRLPVYVVAGATLMGTFVTSIAGVIFYEVIAPYFPEFSVAPDWFLGVLFGLGGACGMYLGARAQRFVPAKIIKYILVASILCTACKYFFDFIA